MIRFKGSTLLINGMVTEGSDEWAVYGGTGAFAMATGVIRRKNLLAGGGDSGGNSDELSVEVFCPVFGSPQQPPKVRTYVVFIGSLARDSNSIYGRVLWQFGYCTAGYTCVRAGRRRWLRRHQDWTMGWAGRIGTGHHDDRGTKASEQRHHSRRYCRRLD